MLVIDKCKKPMLACKFNFIFHFYLPLNYSNLLLLINTSFGIRHCNHQPSATSMVSVKTHKLYKN